MIKFEDKFVNFRWNDKLKGRPCFLADNMEDLRIAFERGDRRFIKEKYSEANPFKAERGFFHFAYFDPNYDNKIAYEEGQQIEYKDMDGHWCQASTPKWQDNIEYRVKPSAPLVIVVLNKDTDIPKLYCKRIREGEKESQHIYFRGTSAECCSYILLHNNFANMMKAWEDGKSIQFLSSDSEWLDVSGEPEWCENNIYRVKPEEHNKRATYRELSEWLAKGKGQYRVCTTATMMFTFMDYTFDADDKEVHEDYLVRPWGSDKWFVPTKEVLNG